MSISHKDADSPNEIRFPNPRKRPTVIKLGQNYVAYEQSRPVEQQTPFTPIIANLLQRVLTSETELKRAERERKTASTELERFLTQAKTIIKTMWKSVTAKYAGKPEQATHWGFQYKANTGNVLLPQTLEERLETMNTYIAQEESLPEAERFTIPELVEVIDLCHALESQADTRVTARRDRESRVETCNELVLELSNYLQAAGIYLLAMEFKFKVSKDLQKWGYEIVAKRSETSPKEATAEEPAPVSEPATNGSAEPTTTGSTGSTTNGSTTLNGTTEVVLDVTSSDS